MHRLFISKGLVFASIALFLAALTQDGYYVEGPNPRAWAAGWLLAVFGWLGILGGVFTWIANPLLVAGWLFAFQKRKIISIILSGSSVLLMLSFLWRRTIITSEAPTYSRIISYQIGYWLWLGSAIVAFSGILLLPKSKKQPNPDDKANAGSGKPNQVAGASITASGESITPVARIATGSGWPCSLGVSRHI